MKNKSKKLGKVTFSSDMFWAMPFVKAMRPLLPIERLKSVSSYKTPITKQEDSEGLIDRNSRGNFTLRVRLTQHEYKIIKNKPLTLELVNRRSRLFWYILSSLCHEAAHLVEWDHTPEHFKLECRLMLRCYKVLVKMNVKDLYRRGLV